MRRFPSALFVMVLAFLTPAVASDDAYQLLRNNPAGFEVVMRGRSFEFPADHLPHPNYRIEWWYLTANLKDADGRDYGVHWTLFRTSMSSEPALSGWSSNQVWMAHGAIHLPSGHIYSERFARGGIGQAGVERSSDGNFDAWLDDWRWQGRGASPLPGTLAFSVEGHRMKLDLGAKTPWVLQGDDGFSQKSAKGQASYYYSQPHIEIKGSLQDEKGVVELEGVGWLDREWSSQPLAPDQPGWDWLSIHLDDGHALMVYRLRQDNGADWISGSWVTPGGESTTLAPEDIVFEPISTTNVNTDPGRVREMPLHWRVGLPDKDLSWTISPITADSWLNTAFPYWEGPVRVRGSTSGVGYLELTGY